MSTVITGEYRPVRACTECALLVANAEGTEERAQLLAARWPSNQWLLVVAPDQSPQFRDRPCEGCGDPLAGDRFLVEVAARPAPARRDPVPGDRVFLGPRAPLRAEGVTYVDVHAVHRVTGRYEVAVAFPNGNRVRRWVDLLDLDVERIT